MKLIQVNLPTHNTYIGIFRKAVNGLGITNHGVERNKSFNSIYNEFIEENPQFRFEYVIELFISEQDSEARWINRTIMLARFYGMDGYNKIPPEITKKLYIIVPNPSKGWVNKN